ncbi:MAG: CopD family protein [Microthrixaceae bacterium]
MIRLRAAALALVMAAAWTLATAAPASAHTGFDGSDPADGATLDAPVEQVTISFTGPAEPTGEGFVALDASGERRTPSDAGTVDGETWVLRFDPPLGGGKVGMRWSVKAPDAHPIDGAFSFTAPAPPAPAETSGTAAATSGLATADDTGEANAGTTTPPAAQATDGAAADDDAASSDLEEFLDPASDSTVAAERIRDLARLISVMGTILGVGALVFAITVLQPTRAPGDDLALALAWTRLSGLGVLAGAALKVLSRANLEAAGSWSETFDAATVGDALSGSAGVSIALQAVGGLALAVGARASLAAPRRSSPAAGEPSPAPWRPSDARLALVGAAIVGLSRLFAGHTVTEGNRVVTAVVDLIHTAAGAVWGGGVVLLVVVLWHRFRTDRDMETATLALRFSVVATAAVVVVALAGVALGIIILDAPSELWTTPWGRLLAVKVAFVAVAAAIGAYNHRRLIPRMEANPEDEGPAGSFRMMIAAEAVALLGTGVVTAFLVGASAA